VSHAFEWGKGVKTDLGSLAAGWSNAATGINGVIDPLIGFPEVRDVHWRSGQIFDLGTEGNQSAALAVNSHGQIAGLALNTAPIPFPSTICFFTVPRTEPKPGRFSGRQTEKFRT